MFAYDTKKQKSYTPTNTMIIQRVTAEVYVDNRSRSSATVIPSNRATGGINHAEQRAWNIACSYAFNRMETRPNTAIRFDVDADCCGDCKAWFKNNLYAII